MRDEAARDLAVSPADRAAGAWRTERSRLVGAGAKLLRDLADAEDCAQDALLAALDAWPRDGMPSNPAAWLVTATRHTPQALDRPRRRAMLQREHEALAAADAAADVLERLGRPAEARQAYLRAAELTANEAQRGLLLERAARLAN